MYEELKRCPFCGAEAELVRNSGGNYFVRCTDRQCAARTRLYHENESGARLAWSRRTERTCRIDMPVIDWETGETDCRCSACGFSADPQDWAETYNYCPNCGAKVVES